MTQSVSSCVIPLLNHSDLARNERPATQVYVEPKNVLKWENLSGTVAMWTWGFERDVANLVLSLERNLEGTVLGANDLILSDLKVY